MVSPAASAGVTTNAAPRHDQREREEEGARRAAGQGDEDRGTAQGDRALDDEPGRAERVRRKQVVEEDDEEAGEGQQDEDRRLRLGPQAGDEDHDGRRHEEDPADDPDDPVVARGLQAVDGLVGQAADHGRIDDAGPGHGRRTRRAPTRSEDRPDDEARKDTGGWRSTAIAMRTTIVSADNVATPPARLGVACARAAGSHLTGWYLSLGRSCGIRVRSCTGPFRVDPG